MNHVIYTRCFFEDDVLFFKYFELLKAIYIPSVCSQTNKSFKIYIHTSPKNPHHLGHIAKEFGGLGIDISCTAFEFQKSTIQTRHDCDDFMFPTYIEKIQSLAKEKFLDHDEFLIQAQPIKHLYGTDKHYLVRKKYDSKCPSMFLTLCQKTPSKTIVDITHTKFNSLVQTLFDLGYKLVKLTIHHTNKISEIKDGDRLIPENKKERFYE